LELLRADRGAERSAVALRRLWLPTSEQRYGEGARGRGTPAGIGTSKALRIDAIIE
jgi:hypothetical protein